MSIVSLESRWSQAMRRVFERAEESPAIEKSDVFLRLFAFPYSLFTVRMIRIIMILMNGHDHARGVHNSSAGVTREPQQPGIPAGAADHKWRCIFVIQTTGEQE